jgi:hypothetical protein
MLENCQDYLSRQRVGVKGKVDLNTSLDEYLQIRLFLFHAITVASSNLDA